MHLDPESGRAGRFFTIPASSRQDARLVAATVRSTAHDGPVKDLRYFYLHRRATRLELFFDLIFVVALRDAGEILVEAHEGHIGARQFLRFVLAGLSQCWR